jgi:hypothetical protein
MFVKQVLLQSSPMKFNIGPSWAIRGSSDCRLGGHWHLSSMTTGDHAVMLGPVLDAPEENRVTLRIHTYVQKGVHAAISVLALLRSLGESPRRSSNASM